MATTERIIPAVVAPDGSVHYSSVTSPPDDSIAVCHMVADRFIPVVFVPGIMGSNLKAIGAEEPVWLVDDLWSIATDWANRGPKKRKIVLDPIKTEVSGAGEIPSGTSQSDAELQRRGWGEVSKMSYGKFLVWLENALNDAHECRRGQRAQLIGKLVASAPGLEPLTFDEVATSYKYQFPVHAVGYNWLQSNQLSAARLEEKIDSFMAYYRRKGYRCEYVILVTHSMGGLVSRYYTQVKGCASKVLGVVHGVMPATGAATAYKRVKAGVAMPTGLVLGADAAEVTAVFAQSPGALQLLPSKAYGRGWLIFSDINGSICLPEQDPYSEIYTQRHKWWGLVDDELINPLDRKQKRLDQDWAAFEKLINEEVSPFHAGISEQSESGAYHPNTYAFYGDDAEHKTWGNVVWKRRLPKPGLWAIHYPPLKDLLTRPLESSGTGTQSTRDYLKSLQQGKSEPFDELVLQEAAENGDGTVPRRSGAAPSGRVKVCVPFKDIDHEGAYKGHAQQLFTLWAIIKIAYSVKQTPMAYTI